MTDHTPYQKKLIERYYDQRDNILLARLSEIVGDLLLAESDRKRKSLWVRADKAMRGLRVPEPLRGHIVSTGDPQVLARNVREWLTAAQTHARRDRPARPRE